MGRPRRSRDPLAGPEAYFSYLRGRSHRLGAVFEHNRLDVLSLTALAGHLAAAYWGADRQISTLRVGLDWAEAGETARAVSMPGYSRTSPQTSWTARP